MELEQYRKELDDINIKLLHLLENRMEVVEKVAEYKRLHQMPILQQSREDAILQTMCAQTKEAYVPAVREFFSMLMRVSREYQYDSHYQNTQLFQLLQTAKSSKQVLPDIPKIVCQGVPGSYSHQCAKEMFQRDKSNFAKIFPMYLILFQPRRQTSEYCRLRILPPDLFYRSLIL